MAVSWSWVYSRKASPSADSTSGSESSSNNGLSSGGKSWGRRSLSTFSGSSWGAGTTTTRGFLRENVRPWSRQTCIDDVISDLGGQKFTHTRSRGVLIRTDAGITEHSSPLEAVEYLKGLRGPDKTHSDKEPFEAPAAASEAERQTLQLILDAAPYGELVGLRVLVDGQYGSIQKVWHGSERVGIDFIIGYDSGKRGMLHRIDASHVLSCDTLNRIHGCPEGMQKRSLTEELTDDGSTSASSEMTSASSEMTVEHSTVGAEFDTISTFGELSDLPEKEREVLRESFAGPTEAGMEAVVEPVLAAHVAMEHLAEMASPDAMLGPADVLSYLPTSLPKEEAARKEAARKAANEAAVEAAQKEAEQAATKEVQAASSETTLEQPSVDAKFETTLTLKEQWAARKASEEEATRKAANEAAEAARKAEQTAKVSDRAAFWETKIRLAGS